MEAPRNFIRVEGDTFRIEKQGSLACLSWNGVGTSPHFSALLNLNDSGGWTVNVSSAGVYTVASGNTNFAALSIGDLISISGMANAGNNGTFFVQGIASNGLSFSIANPSAVAESGTAVSPGAFSSTASVSEGDTVILSSPFAPLNQGQYRVIRRFNDSIWYENPNVVEEEVTCSANLISTGYDATTAFNVAVSGGTETLVWNGSGTAPSLGVALPGDIVTFGFRILFLLIKAVSTVVSSGVSQQQVVELIMPSGATFASSGPADYFEIYNGGNANQYYVWFNVLSGSNTDPAPVGFTGIQVNINPGDSASTVASRNEHCFGCFR